MSSISKMRKRARIAQTRSYYYQTTPKDYSNKNKNLIYQNIWDIIIIGAGISGVVSAELIKEKYPDKNILIIERDNDVGGCVVSVTRNYPETTYNNSENRRAIEFGGMRYFKDLMPRVHQRVEKYGLTSIPINVTSGNNVLLSNNKVDKISNIDVSYFDTIPKNIETFILNRTGENKYIDLLEFNKRKQIFNMKDLSEKNIPSFFIPKTINSYDFNKFRRNNGYNGLIESPISTAMTLFEILDLSQYEQNVVVEGYQTLVKKILEYNNASILTNSKNKLDTFNFKDNQHTNLFVSLNTSALRVEPKNNTIYTNKGNIRAKQIIYTLPPKHMLDLTKNILPNKVADEFQNGFWDYKAFKIVLCYDEPWWDKSYIGRNLADTNIGQLWVWDDVTLLIYCCDIAANYWMDIFDININNNYGKTIEYYDNINKNEIPSWYKNNVLPLIYELFTNLSEDNITKSHNLVGYGYSSWEHHVPFWKSRSSNVYGTILNRRELLRYPLGKNRKDHIYISNATSLRQGWVDGSIEEAEEGLKEIGLL